MLSNMNYRRRFNAINKEPFPVSISPANHDATPSFLYAIKLFILAYFCMIGIDIICKYILIAKINLRKKKEPVSPDLSPTTEQEPESPDFTPPTPLSTPVSTPVSTPETTPKKQLNPPPAPKKAEKTKNMFRPITRSMTSHVRKRGLDLFS